jgi:hypothetical protein
MREIRLAGIGHAPFAASLAHSLGSTTMDFTPILGNEVTFSSDPLAYYPQVTALADGSFILAWEDGTDIFAKHPDKNGSFTSGNFL